MHMVGDTDCTYTFEGLIKKPVRPRVSTNVNSRHLMKGSAV